MTDTVENMTEFAKTMSEGALIDAFLDAEHDERYAANDSSRRLASESATILKAELDRRGIA